MNDNDTLAHFGIPGMRWGQRKAPDELAYKERKTANDRLYSDRKKAKRNGSIMGGAIGALGGITVVDLMSRNEPKPVKQKGLAYVKSLFKKTPPAVVPNPQKLNTANMAFRALTKTKYGKAVAALGGFAIAASIGSKVAGSSFDKDQIDPTRLAARDANTATAQAIADAMTEATRKKIQDPTPK